MPAPAARACVSSSQQSYVFFWNHASYQRGFAIAETLHCKMNRDETATASGIDRHTRSMEIERIRNTIGHDGDAITCRGILWLPVRVSKTNLFVVCTMSEVGVVRFLKVKCHLSRRSRQRLMCHSHQRLLSEYQLCTCHVSCAFARREIPKIASYHSQEPHMRSPEVAFAEDQLPWHHQPKLRKTSITISLRPNRFVSS